MRLINHRRNKNNNILLSAIAYEHTLIVISV